MNTQRIAERSVGLHIILCLARSFGSFFSELLTAESALTDAAPASGNTH